MEPDIQLKTWDVTNAYDLLTALQEAEEAVVGDENGEASFVSYVEVGPTKGGPVDKVILWKKKLSDGSFVFDLELKIEEA